MAKKEKIGLCIFCGEVLPLTRDHVPPKSFFSKPRPFNLITVPCCYSCNKKYQNLDKRMFSSFAMTLSSEIEEYKELIERAIRDLKRDTLLNKNIRSRYTPTDMYTKAGIYLGPTFKVNVDLDDLNEMMIRIVLGIHFNEFKESISQKDFDIVGIDIDKIDEMPPESSYLFRKVLTGMDQIDIKSIGKTTFKYKYKRYPELIHSTYFFSFYSKFNYCYIAMPKNFQLTKANENKIFKF